MTTAEGVLTALAVAAAAACLVAALVTHGWRQLAIGGGAAAVVLAAGAVTPHRAGEAVTGLLAVVGYLVAILLLGTLAERGGVFAWLGYAVANGARGARARPRRLLLLATLAAAGVTVFLTLDATVVLLAPVLVAAARALSVDAWQVDLASVRLANSASILLPVSNLTNLVAFGASGLGFGEFALLMAPVWLVVVGIEFAVLRATTPTPAAAAVTTPRAEPPDRFTLVVLGAALVGVVVASEIGSEPVWPALAAAAVLGLRALVTSRPALRLRPGDLVKAAGLPFAAFVLCWSVAVAALASQGGSALLDRVLPQGNGMLALIGVALIAMLTANVVNNLPATLLLVPLVAGAGNEVAVLAVLIGVGVGASTTYAGSLATLLWLRNPALHHPADVGRRFHAHGLVLSPILVVVATVVLSMTAAVLGVA